ncbi:GAL3ST1 [Branchiostoma lanceolatum]|uniref:GAL3ST1 protein n=1 Tax=Branchiostoma lanceolatum TaxID=7740 RepID=A0A8J9ZIG5_BRALA|nr:GAL3ST1 [Branchiostoma lanceolatum]
MGNERVDTLKLATAITFGFCVVFMLYVTYTPDEISEFVLLNNRLHPVLVRDAVMNPPIAQVGRPGSQHIEAPLADGMKTAEKTCTPKRNFVFIKVQEAASNTVQRILLRYAYQHNLTVMLPATGASFRWLTFTDEFDGLPVKDQNYNVITHHLRYSKEIKKKMPADTVYFTILQHPVHHMKSSFHQWKLHKHYNISSEDPLNAFFKDPYLYSVKDAATFKTYHPIKNRQAFDLGFDMSWQWDDENAKAHFKEVKQEIRVVLLVERFEESLVLLKRLMCWDMQDILYQPDSNFETNRYTNVTLLRKQETTFKNWSSIDFALYDYSQKVFNETSQHIGPGFLNEVQYFRRLNSWVYFEGCRGHRGRNVTHFGVEKSRWHDRFEWDGSLFRAIERRRGIWDAKLALRQNEELRKSKGNQLQIHEGKNISEPAQKLQEIPTLSGKRKSIGLKSKTKKKASKRIHAEEKEEKIAKKHQKFSMVGRKTQLANLILEEKKKKKRKKAKEKGEKIKSHKGRDLWGKKVKKPT